ncbi:MAG: 30S ribosome-binding factor RbfA [Candidatus Marinimicrobia bacterium]|nr:30S ribosome-binding factor RbfA [Candidatus Neomarinimicrobiota bacterium]
MKQERPYKRTDRVGNQICEILGEIASRHIRLSHLGFVTFTKTIISPDLRNAKVFFSVINPKKDMNQIIIEMNKLRKAFKKYLAPELHLKNIPDLHFYFDESIVYANKLDSIFHTILCESEDDL